jgi:hypothetical protein
LVRKRVLKRDMEIEELRIEKEWMAIVQGKGCR